MACLLHFLLLLLLLLLLPSFLVHVTHLPNILCPSEPIWVQYAAA
jgi:hypothetical protein